MVADGGTGTPTASEALARLTEGNRRFVSGATRSGAFRRESLAELVDRQRPFAAILGCSDSRVPPAWVFDAGVGELFVVRVAGNVLSAEVAGSLQYATSHLGTPLLLVLGHEGCGAFEAAFATRRDGARFPSHVQGLVDTIVAGLPDPHPSLSPGDELARAVEANVRSSVERLAALEGQPGAPGGSVMIVGAIYDLATGRVRYLEGIKTSPDRTR